MRICVCAVSSLCSVYFSSTSHTAPTVHTTVHPVSTDPYRSGVSRPWGVDTWVDWGMSFYFFKLDALYSLYVFGEFKAKI